MSEQLEAKVNAILRCLTCEQCGGSGKVLEWPKDPAINVISMPNTVACSCRVEARKLLE